MASAVARGVGAIVSVACASSAQSDDDKVKASGLSQRRVGKDVGQDADKKVFTRKEVAQHKEADDCWVIVKGKVYNVSGWGENHPGGSVVYTYGGRDATDVFSTFHATSTWDLLKDFYIGRAEDDEVPTDLVRDFRALRQQMLQEKMFDASPVFYTYKFCTTLGLAVASVSALRLFGSGWVPLVVSAVLMALFFQQSGWLGHDFCHHQVFKNRKLNNVFAVITGNLWQGFSVAWWKSKHNTHHAAPNECNGDHSALDPDIDTLPLLAWSTDMLHENPTTLEKFMVKRQSFMIWPLLCFARLVWLYRSWQFLVLPRKSAEKMKSYSYDISLSPSTIAVETGFILLHHAWVFSVAFLTMRPERALVWLCIAEGLAGFMIGYVFVQSHNGMEIYTDPKDFFLKQIVSTRDVKGTMFNNWFSGGLNKQIEHHLFPTLPRHNLHRISKPVADLCKKHGLVYEDVSFVEATTKVLRHLVMISQQASY